MSFENLGNILNKFGASFGNIKEIIQLLNSLGGTSFANISKISTVLNNLTKVGDLSAGISAIKQISTILQTFDGSVVSAQ